MVLPKSMRLKGYKCFDHLHRSGIRFHGSLMVLRVSKALPSLMNPKTRPIKTQSCRCAVSISSKVSKKAVVRNRLRRIVHDHLKERLLTAPNHSDKWALISLKPNSSYKNAAPKDTSPLLRECDKLLREAGLLS